MPTHLPGYFPIMPTPYREDGSVDLPSVCRLTRFLIDSGAQGMSPNGGDSEGSELTVEERKGVLETVLDENGGRHAGTGGSSLAHRWRGGQVHRRHSPTSPSDLTPVDQGPYIRKRHARHA